jgi:hypothetical protein
MIGSLFAATLRIDGREHNLQISRDLFSVSLLEGVKADPRQDPEGCGSIRTGNERESAFCYELEERQ